MHLAAHAKLQGYGPQTCDIRSTTFAFILQWRVRVARVGHRMHHASRAQCSQTPIRGRSIQTTFLENAASEDRTHNLRIMGPMRCQLRYRHHADSCCWPPSFLLMPMRLPLPTPSLGQGQRFAKKQPRSIAESSGAWVRSTDLGT